MEETGLVEDTSAISSAVRGIASNEAKPVSPKRRSVWSQLKANANFIEVRLNIVLGYIILFLAMPFWYFVLSESFGKGRCNYETCDGLQVVISL